MSRAIPRTNRSPLRIFAERLRRSSMLVFGVAMGLSLALFYSGDSGMAQYLMLLAAAALICAGNLGSRERHRQWLLPLLAIVAVIALAILAARIRGGYLALLQYLDYWIRLIESWLNVQFPRDIVGLLALLNGFLLFAWGGIKLFVAGIIRVRDLLPLLSRSKRPDVASSFGAYAFSPLQGWYLQPQWYFARHLSIGLTLLSGLGFLACWLVFTGSMQATWVPILPAAMIVLFGEIAAYLGGEHDPAGDIRFGGEDVLASPWANYEAVWRDLRRSFWVRQWLAAGNRFLWGNRK